MPRLTRRALLAAVLPFCVFAQAVTPKNRLANAANAFNALFSRWADAFNRVKSGGLDVGECEAWEPLPDQFRRVEHARMEWIRGNK